MTGAAAEGARADEEQARSYFRTTVSIAAAVGFGSLSFSFWQPFLPLYLLEIGASSEADAVFWIAVAIAAQGVTRFVSGPIWGLLSDRVGRKLMFLRALYFGTLTTLVMALVTSPWQLTIAFACQGLFSGFVPASVALVSVSVPDSRMNWSMSLVTGAQYLGATLGPAIGAVLAIAVGYRGAIYVAALLPALLATAVVFLVPSDIAGSGRTAGRVQGVQLERFSPTFQFLLAIFLFFFVFSVTQLLRLVTPIALKEIQGGDVAGVTGITFTLGGLASALAVLFLTARFFRSGQMRAALVISSVVTGACHLLLAVTETVPAFVIGFSLISLLEAAMIPATNTLIAANVSRARRGTAFGIAGSAQALSFMAGPMAAALFAAISLDLGFAVLGVLFFAMALLLSLSLREVASSNE